MVGGEGELWKLCAPSLVCQGRASSSFQTLTLVLRSGPHLLLPVITGVMTGITVPL